MGHIEVVLIGFHSHEALVFMTGVADIFFHCDIVAAEAADLVVMSSFHI